jgi:hypothetical protein
MDSRNLTFPGGLILGVGLVYLFACLFARRAREADGSATAFDLDAPNYAWLR